MFSTCYEEPSNLCDNLSTCQVLLFHNSFYMKALYPCYVSDRSLCVCAGIQG